MALIQTETPYFQSNPNAITPFVVNAAYNDPDFSQFCSASSTAACPKAWGLRITNSKDVLIYGAGLYSFFDNYDQTCLDTENCQDNMVDVENSSNINFYALNTKAATNMVTLNGVSAAKGLDNDNNFCQGIAHFYIQGDSAAGIASKPATSSSVPATYKQAVVTPVFTSPTYAGTAAARSCSTKKKRRHVEYIK